MVLTNGIQRKYPNPGIKTGLVQILLRLRNARGLTNIIRLVYLIEVEWCFFKLFLVWILKSVIFLVITLCYDWMVNLTRIMDCGESLLFDGDTIGIMLRDIGKGIRVES